MRMRKRTYPAKAAAARRREARLRALNPPQPRYYGPIWVDITKNTAKTCQVDACSRDRVNLWRFCRVHTTNYRSTGHPVARQVRRGVWKPYVDAAERFIREQLRAEHPGIMAALRWISDELQKAENPTEALGLHHVHYAAALIRARNHGVDPVTFLARWIGGYLADSGDRRRTGLFANDEHMLHQIASLYLLPRPFGRQSWAKRTLVEQDSIRDSNTSLPTRVYVYERVNAQLGVLALKAAETILERQRQQQQDS